MAPPRDDAVLDFFANQTVFLTGSTGGLGGCVLYKLAVTLKAARIFVLVRHDAETVRRKWEASMGIKADDIFSNDRVVLLAGDCTKPRLGLSAKDYLAVQKSVSVIINASANIDFYDPLVKLVASNCLSALEIAALGAAMPNLRRFVHVSTAYANSFLDDGLVEEKVYPFGNPESELLQVLEGRTPAQAGYHAWPYGYSKHLAEQLLVQRFPRLPLLIVRPSSVGPALEVPFSQYMPQASCPLSNMYARLIYPTGGANTWHVPDGVSSGSNILDEIPVDIVANMMLQHVCRGTAGVVHAGSELYIPRTLDHFLADLEEHVPDEWRRKMAKNVFTADLSQRQCKIANFYRVTTRDWWFCTLRSAGLDSTGPLGLSPQDHDPDTYVRDRLAQVMRSLPKDMLRECEGKGLALKASRL
ncbi:hypothetical protein PG999_005605 [Apiospora kogelbergensis]|uniref:Fatty acyl-CoA reductase n=1 Tax=Apiospora kogelbergensis TaxID=1337665 RepID=A0AAW0R2L9_9PEZI